MSLQKESILTKMSIIPETKQCIEYLKDRNIKIGITTSFPKEHMDLCIQVLNEHSIYPDVAVSSTCIPNRRRPEPHMIQEVMKQLNIKNPKEILKVDDEVIGIKEGLNANVYTCSVARWSFYMDISNEIEGKSIEGNKRTYERKLDQSRKILMNSGTNYLINTLDSIYKPIDHINRKFHSKN